MNAWFHYTSDLPLNDSLSEKTIICTGNAPKSGETQIDIKHGPTPRPLQPAVVPCGVGIHPRIFRTLRSPDDHDGPVLRGERVSSQGAKTI